VLYVLLGLWLGASFGTGIYAVAIAVGWWE
jgi:hypothetical protein